MLQLASSLLEPDGGGQREMVRGEGGGGEEAGPEAGEVRELQGGDCLEAGGGEDVVQHLHLPPALPHLAGGELRLPEVVGARQLEDGRGEDVQQRLLRLGVEVAGEEDVLVLPDAVDPLDQLPALLRPHHHVQPPRPRLEVSGGADQPPAGVCVAETEGQTHLVAGHSPH